jgi:excisionase family DNA binding protein
VNMPKNQLYTVEEVADYLRVSERTIRRMIEKKMLRAVRIGSRVRIPLSELDRFTALDGGTTSSNAAASAS